jgi:transposase
MEPRQPSPTDVTDKAWAFIAPYVLETKRGGRPENYATRAILHGIFDSLRGGCAWRLLPHDLPPGEIVSHDCWIWRQAGTWPHRHDLRRGEVRVATGQPRQPRAGLLDRQAVQTTETGGATVMISPHTSRAAHVISAVTREAGSCGWWSRPPLGQTATGPCRAWLSSAPSCPDAARSGPIRRMPATCAPGCGRCGRGGTSAGRWSGGPRGPRASCACRHAGWWNGPSAGATGTAASQRMMRM